MAAELVVPWWVAFKHQFPTYIPWELRDYAAGLRFARWMVLKSRVSDWPLWWSALASSPTPTSELAGTLSAGSPRARAT